MPCKEPTYRELVFYSNCHKDHSTTEYPTYGHYGTRTVDTIMRVMTTNSIPNIDSIPIELLLHFS